MLDLHAVFGDVDIYLFDQLLRGPIAPGMRVLDAGCGARLMASAAAPGGTLADPLRTRWFRIRGA